MEFDTVAYTPPEGVNVIVGQAHFVKTVEDLHETLATSAPQLRFGVAFCEASGARLVRVSGNDDELAAQAGDLAQRAGTGHAFVVLLREGFPINVLNQVLQVPEVCGVFCATANPVELLVAETGLGRAVIGVVDGQPPVGVETAQDQQERHDLLRAIGYKL